jgi:antitoxin VapB
MAFHIRDAATDEAVRRLAALTGESLTDAVRHAAEHRYDAIKGKPSLAERIRPLQDELAAMRRPGGLPADKAFFDELSGDI